MIRNGNRSSSEPTNANGSVQIVQASTNRGNSRSAIAQRLPTVGRAARQIDRDQRELAVHHAASTTTVPEAIAADPRLNAIHPRAERRIVGVGAGHRRRVGQVGHQQQQRELRQEHEHPRHRGQHVPVAPPCRPGVGIDRRCAQSHAAATPARAADRGAVELGGKRRDDQRERRGHDPAEDRDDDAARPKTALVMSVEQPDHRADRPT